LAVDVLEIVGFGADNLDTFFHRYNYNIPN
jgi:hypothetical protein